MKIRILSRRHPCLMAITCFLFITACVTMTASAVGLVSGKINTSRTEGHNADSEKYAQISFFAAGDRTTPLKIATVEIEATNTQSVPFSLELARGMYDMVVTKTGYLDSTFQNIFVRNGSLINLPDIQLIPGDLNRDGNVNMSDFVVALRGFDTESAFAYLGKLADLNEDGTVSVADLGLMKSRENYGKTKLDSLGQYQIQYDSGSTYDEALYLIDDNEHPYSGWDFDNRGQSYMSRTYYASYSFADESTVYPTMLKRDFVSQEKGTLTLEGNFTISSDSNEFVYHVADKDGNDAFQLSANNGFYYLLKRDGTQVQVGTVTGGKSSLKVLMNLDAKTYDAYLNNSYCGNFAFSENGGALCKLLIGYTEAGEGKADIAGVKLYTNYAVNERFLTPFANVVPADWTVSASNGIPSVKTISSPNNTFSQEDVFVLKMDNTGGNVTKLSKHFDAISGNFCYETKFILPTATNGVTFLLGSETKPVFRVMTADGVLKAGTGETLQVYVANVWNTLRVEINAKQKTAFVRFNGKDIGTYALENAYSVIDSLTVKMETATSASMCLDDILLFPMVPEPADYCPEPVAVNSDGYYVGVHVCNLWRNGFWRGTNAAWDICTAFDELTPYMGYYDEGIPEVADWEIKWMAEHGIDYQLMCWYAPVNITEPVKFAGFSQALHDGFMNAKYKNDSKFAIMWENNFTTSVTSEQFRNNLVPYWIAYYFSDPSYMVIDNKPVFSIYNFDKMCGYFGGVQQAKVEMDYLRQQVKNLGFDDLILLFAGASGSSATKIANMETVGADGSYSYNWGTQSYTSAYQQSVITGVSDTFAASSSKVAHIPTVGVGFNAVARNDVRTPSISLSEYEKILTWTKNTLLTNTKYFPNQTSWKSKMLLLSCWNEFDEGHYINPSNLYGFGFLDTLKKVLTANPVHTDLKPTENQVSRLQIMAPKDRAVLRPLRRYVKPIPTEAEYMLKSWSFATTTDAAKWSVGNSTNVSLANEKLSATSTGTDSLMKLADNSISIPATDADYIHIKCKITPSDSSPTVGTQIFFTTNTAPSWTGTQCKTFVVQSGVTVDQYFSMADVASWSGNITSLRFDPMMGAGTFEVELIEIVKDYDEFHLTIDGGEVKFDYMPDTKYGHNLFPLNPKLGIFNDLNAYYEWNKTTGTLMMQVENTTFYFTMENTDAQINGQKVTLAVAPYLIDGIPMIPLDEVCSHINGYSYTRTGELTAEIKTTNYAAMKALHDIVNARVANEWEFNYDGDRENWACANCVSSKVVAGSYYGTSTSNDPNLSFNGTLAVDTSVYKKVVVRMRHNLTGADSAAACFYFAKAGGSLTETNTVKVGLSGKSSGQNYVDYVFDMSTNANWTGIVDTLRFDPFATSGEFWIDSIKFIKET